MQQARRACLLAWREANDSLKSKVPHHLADCEECSVGEGLDDEFQEKFGDVIMKNKSKGGNGMVDCPHCGKPFKKRGLTRHMNGCSENPDNQPQPDSKPPTNDPQPDSKPPMTDLAAITKEPIPKPTEPIPELQEVEEPLSGVVMLAGGNELEIIIDLLIQLLQRLKKALTKRGMIRSRGE